MMLLPTIAHLIALTAASPAPKNNVNSLIARADDPCAEIWLSPNGTSRYDCQHVTTLGKDGHCPVQSTDQATDCQRYCEVRRRAFLGDEIIVGGPNGATNFFEPGQQAQLTEGIEISIEKSIGGDISFGAGASGVLDKVFGFGVNFQYTIGKTKTTSIALSEMPSDTFYSTWVAFPILIETCGTTTKTDSKLLFGAKGQAPIQVCTDKNPKSIQNTCSTVPYIEGSDKDAKPKVMYALRYQETTSVAAAMDKQGKAYQAICLDFRGGKCQAGVPLDSVKVPAVNPIIG